MNPYVACACPRSRRHSWASRDSPHCPFPSARPKQRATFYFAETLTMFKAAKHDRAFRTVEIAEVSPVIHVSQHSACRHKHTWRPKYAESGPGPSGLTDDFRLASALHMDDDKASSYAFRVVRPLPTT